MAPRETVSTWNPSTSCHTAQWKVNCFSAKIKTIKMDFVLRKHFTSASSFRFGSEVVQRRVIVETENVFENGISSGFLCRYFTWLLRSSRVFVLSLYSISAELLELVSEAASFAWAKWELQLEYLRYLTVNVTRNQSLMLEVIYDLSQRYEEAPSIFDRRPLNMNLKSVHMLFPSF